MNQSLPELMDEILIQIREQFEAAVEILAKQLEDLAATKEGAGASQMPPTLSTDALDGDR